MTRSPTTAVSPAKFIGEKNESFTIIKGDLNQENLSWVDSLPGSLDACIHTAGVVHAYNINEFYRVNTDGTSHLINNLKKKFTHLKFVLISSLAAAGPALDKNKRAEGELDFPISIYGRSKKQAEEVGGVGCDFANSIRRL